MIEDPVVTIIYGKHAVYFKFLKRFIDIPFVLTVRQISSWFSLALLMCQHYLLE